MRRQTARIADPALGLTILVERQRQRLPLLRERLDRLSHEYNDLTAELERNEKALAVLRGSPPALEMGGQP